MSVTITYTLLWYVYEGRVVVAERKLLKKTHLQLVSTGGVCTSIETFYERVGGNGSVLLTGGGRYTQQSRKGCEFVSGYVPCDCKRDPS